MAPYNFDALSAQDQSFLVFETPNLHMHVASIQIFELGPLATPEGGVDYPLIKRFIESILHRIPRYRQKLAKLPIDGRCVWIDDRHFDIDYHVRHTSLPRPGSEEQLKALGARVAAQQLARARPLWEYWVVEGLEGGRFALISKIHHCMIDGSSGVEIGQILQSPTPDRSIHDAPRFIPRPEPTHGDLLRHVLSERLAQPARALRSFQAFRKQSEDWREEARFRAKVLFEAITQQSQKASETPINGDVGPHRSYDWMRVPLSDMKALRKALSCTINDVVLAVVAGAFREYLLRRQVRPDELDFKIQAPVSVRREDEKDQLGNRVSGWMVRLPLEEKDPLQRLERIRETTREIKGSNQALGVDLMFSIMDVMPTGLLSLGAQAASGVMNSIVTNVPGPQFPLYLLGAEMTEMFPQVPLLAGVGLGIALISYNGRVCWGFNADPELVPDLGAFVALIGQSLQQLADAAHVRLGADLPAAPE
jgi:WS/DGAT/MGAT family acyltransferase